MLTQRNLLVFACSISVGVLACEQEPAKPTAASSASASAAAPAKVLPPMPKAAPLPATPAFFPELKTPEDNPLTPEKVELGRQLFFDKRLSKDGSASCETCHVPEKGWADGLAFSTKVGGGVNTRHSPGLWNVGYNELYYWDGRSVTLEKQVEAAWKGQMGADLAAVAAAIGKIPGYEVQFQTIFKGPPTPETVVKAIASFVRTIRSGDAPYDKYSKGDKSAADEAVERGFELFRNKAGCAACHVPPLYTDNLFHNVGIGYDKPKPDTGRGKITKNEKEDGAFKTPSLRSVTTHAPYFHDGRAATIEEAVDYMLSGGIRDKNPNIDKALKKVTLSKAERDDLLAFIKSLEVAVTSYERPKLPEGGETGAAAAKAPPPAASP